MVAWQPENAEAFLGKDGLIDTHRLLDATAEAERLARLDSQHEGIPVSDPRFHMPFSDPATVREVLEQATLSMPAPEAWMQSGGRSGRHSEHLGHLLAEMQHLQRTYPGAVW